MKKLLFTFMLAMLGMAIMAQTTAVTKQTATVSKDYYTYKYIGNTAVDTLGAVRDSIVYPIYVESPNPTYYDFKIRLHELVSACNINVKLQAKKFISDDWADVASRAYKGAGTDTSILFTQVSTLQHYNYYQIILIRSANKARLTDLTAVFKR